MTILTRPSSSMISVSCPALVIKALWILPNPRPLRNSAQPVDITSARATQSAWFEEDPHVLSQRTVHVVPLCNDPFTHELVDRASPRVGAQEPALSHRHVRRKIRQAWLGHCESPDTLRTRDGRRSTNGASRSVRA